MKNLQFITHVFYKHCSDVIIVIVVGLLIRKSLVIELMFCPGATHVRQRPVFQQHCANTFILIFYSIVQHWRPLICTIICFSCIWVSTSVKQRRDYLLYLKKNALKENFKIVFFLPLYTNVCSKNTCIAGIWLLWIK